MTGAGDDLETGGDGSGARPRPAQAGAGKGRSRPGVTVGVASGIACYRACDVVRELRRRGFRVRVVMTENARRFVGADLFEALTGEPVGVSTFGLAGLSGPYAKYPHLFFARDIAAFAVVPATYNVIGKLAAGLADDLLTTSLAATDAPILLFPAMNAGMYAQEALRDNLARLRTRGVQVLEPDSGDLACGDRGEGRLPGVERICEAVETAARGGHRTASALDGPPERPAHAAGPGAVGSASLAGWSVLVTAGPTREPIDPVRFISNPSTGAMGYAMAAEAARRGARVLLVSGPTHLPAPPGVCTVRVGTHEEMRRAVLESLPGKDALVMAAAVGDFRAAQPSASKLKKTEPAWNLPLERTEDILHEAGLRREDGTLLVGFALETEDLEENARVKLRSKGLDWVVANDALEPGAGFGTTTNRVTLLGKQGARVVFPTLDKGELAARLWDVFAERRVQTAGSA